MFKALKHLKLKFFSAKLRTYVTFLKRSRRTEGILRILDLIEVHLVSLNINIFKGTVSVV